VRSDFKLGWYGDRKPRLRLIALAALLSWPGLRCKERRQAASLSRAVASSAVESDVLVVLGSSTAAGTGPDEPESAWVERYRAYLKRTYPKLVIANLAVGGYTTFHIQPSDYVPPPHRPAPVPGHNVSSALELRPKAIIINMPSNDQASKYPLPEQLANYERVTELAGRHRVLVWITTTQPRNFSDRAQQDQLTLARDAIKERYGDRSLDFWSPFAAAGGAIKAEYDAGDGTHLNAAAHALLAERVIAAKIPEQVLAASP
jgi:lysophospholipase L1-like esterase